LRTGGFVGAESLVRWQHPTRGMVPPMDFIPFAEQTGFVRQLTLWMLEATAQQWRALSALGLKSLSVNLSTRDLLDQELQNKIERILHRHGMPPAALCLEITESAIMDEPQRALATLNALSLAGYKLSIDDFGTGYSSLAYLKRLPVNELKIDRSFVMAMEQDADDAKIVRSTIDLAHNLGLTVVAEGVENVSVMHLLAELQCDQAQGYHMSRPLPAAEMMAFAARWNALQSPLLPADAMPA
jgi:EAL domain-containing protein (putative c-di-GMP-specific phosphodiesterase class I)